MQECGSMLDVTFSFKHDCYYCNLSKDFPEATMVVCCNDKKDILELTSVSPHVVEAAIRKLRLTGTEIERSERGNRVVVVTDRCLCNLHADAETQIHMDLGVLLVSPRVFSGGWEQRRIIGFDNGHVREIMRSLQENYPVKIISKRPIKSGLMGELFSLTTNQLFGGVTERQIEAVLLAFREGYYTMPRKTTTARLAKSFGTSRATYEEHLRKAENKIIKTLCDHVHIDTLRSASQMISGGSPPDNLHRKSFYP